MSARIECYVYASAEASMAEAYTLSVTEPGPTVVDVTLTQPLRFTDALTEWQTQLNASALAGTYTIAWAAASQSVVISATGVASFAVEFRRQHAQALRLLVGHRPHGRAVLSRRPAGARPL
jgi:hypothetical protein